MSDRKHAILSASSAHRWLNCTPSAMLEVNEDRECSVYAEEGTAAHALAELKLSYRFNKIDESTYTKEYDNFVKTSPYYDKAFEDYVDEFVEYVQNVVDESTGYEISFEERVDFSQFVPNGFGTADVLIKTEDAIDVIDLKFGAGIPVSAINNPQLRLYGLGALAKYPEVKTVRTTIYQPRLDSHDTETLTTTELLTWANEVVKPRAELAIRGEGEIKPTEDGCRFCSIKGKCKVRADMALAEAQQEFAIAVPEYNQEIAQTLTPEQLSRVLEVAPKLIDWFKDVQAYALGQLIAGVKIPGFKLVEGRSNRVITDEDRVKEILLSVGLRENEIMSEPSLLGISKLEALVGKKLFAALCKDYIIKPIGKLTFARDDDRRQELNTVALAQRDFATPIEQ